MSAYQYSALPPGHIRMILLKPNRDNTAPIECQLLEYPFEGTNRHRYEALSYTWGDPEITQPITVNQIEFNVTTNLYAALSHLRDHMFDRILWVDAICINQKNEKEKETQIQFMGAIYANASSVIVWLGEASSDSDLAFEYIQAVAEYDRSQKDPAVRIEEGDSDVSSDGGLFADIDFESDSNIESDNESGSNSETEGDTKDIEYQSFDFNIETANTATTALLKRPWFRRVWVLQEVGAARGIRIMSGSKEMNGYAFCSGLNNLHLRFEDSDLQGIIQSATYLIRQAPRRPIGTVAPRKLSIGELLDMYHTHESTKRHDKIYALLGLCSDDLDKAGLVPDYSVPWHEVFRQLIHYLLPDQKAVQTWPDREVAMIEGEATILGRVLSVAADDSWYDRQHVEFVLNEMAVDWGYRDQDIVTWTLQASAKSIQKNDILCLLKGASEPSIIRTCRDHFAVILLRATRQRTLRARAVDRSKNRDSSESVRHKTLLTWNWEISSAGLHKHSASINVTDFLPDYTERGLKSESLLDAARILASVVLHKKAGRRLAKAATSRRNEFGEDHLETLAFLEKIGRQYSVLDHDSRWQKFSNKPDLKRVEFWNRAKQILLDVISTRKKLGGGDDPRIWNSRAILASIYMDSYHNPFIDNICHMIRQNEKTSQETLISLVERNFPGVLELLFDQQGDSLDIPEEMAVKAAGNMWSDLLMEVLLKEKGDSVPITERVIEEAKNNSECGEAILGVIRKYRGKNLPITDDAFDLAVERAKHVGQRLIYLKFYSN